MGLYEVGMGLVWGDMRLVCGGMELVWGGMGLVWGWYVVVWGWYREWFGDDIKTYFLAITKCQTNNIRKSPTVGAKAKLMLHRLNKSFLEAI